MKNHHAILELIDKDKIYEDVKIDIMDISQTDERHSLSGCEQSKNIMDYYFQLKGEVNMRILVESNNYVLGKIDENHQKNVKGVLLPYNINNLTDIEMRYCYYRFTRAYSVKQIHEAMNIAQSTQKIHYRACCEKYDICGKLDKGVKAAIMQNYWIAEFPNWKDIKIIIVTH
jgi:hypothetical protein